MNEIYDSYNRMESLIAFSLRVGLELVADLTWMVEKVVYIFPSARPCSFYGKLHRTNSAPESREIAIESIGTCKVGTLCGWPKGLHQKTDPSILFQWLSHCAALYMNRKTLLTSCIALARLEPSKLLCDGLLPVQ